MLKLHFKIYLKKIVITVVTLSFLYLRSNKLSLSKQKRLLSKTLKDLTNFLTVMYIFCLLFIIYFHLWFMSELFCLLRSLTSMQKK